MRSSVSVCVRKSNVGGTRTCWNLEPINPPWHRYTFNSGFDHLHPHRPLLLQPHKTAIPPEPQSRIEAILSVCLKDPDSKAVGFRCENLPEDSLTVMMRKRAMHIAESFQEPSRKALSDKEDDKYKYYRPRMPHPLLLQNSRNTLDASETSSISDMAVED